MCSRVENTLIDECWFQFDKIIQTSPKPVFFLSGLLTDLLGNEIGAGPKVNYFTWLGVLPLLRHLFNRPGLVCDVHKSGFSLWGQFHCIELQIFTSTTLWHRHSVSKALRSAILTHPTTCISMGHFHATVIKSDSPTDHPGLYWTHSTSPTGVSGSLGKSPWGQPSHLGCTILAAALTWWGTITTQDPLLFFLLALNRLTAASAKELRGNYSD